MIEAQHLTRKFGDFVAVDDLNLTITPGELFGFLGMNGAGKTTTMRMMVGLLRPSMGKVAICGYDIEQQPLKAKKHFGYIAQDPYLYDKLSGREFLYFLGGLHQLQQSQIADQSTHLLDLLDLTEKADQLIESYSGGMRRKIALCGALLHNPQVLILDEPFAGLDPLSARRIKDLLGRLCDEGKTVLMSTHTLEIAERVCTRFGIIDQGKLIAQGTMAELQGVQQEATLEDLFLQLAAEGTTSEVVKAL